MTTRIAFRILLFFALVASACGGSDSSDVANLVDEIPTAVAEPEVAEEPEPTAVAEPEQEPEPEPAEAAEPEPEPEPEEVEEPEPEPEEVEEAELEPTEEPEPEPADGSTAALVSGCGSGGTPGITSQLMSFEDREREYEQVVPASYDDATPLPLVLNWHGLGSNGVEQIGFSDYATLADEEGFIVIAPTGIPSPGDTRNSWELDPDQDPTRDDLAFANELLDTVIETLCVDESRVYTTGMSNGGYFSSLLICEMADRIAAAASVAALSHPDDCDPSRIVPYIGFHGTNDQVVPFAGGGESSLAPGEQVALFLLEIPAEFAEFAVAAGCAIEPVVTEVADDVNSYAYQECTDDVEMTFYEIEEGGHTWPGSLVSVALSEALGLGKTTTGINASQVSWEFFSQYALTD